MNIQAKTKQLLQTAINNEIRKEMEEWPPVCVGLIYQPKRPAMPQPVHKEEA